VPLAELRGAKEEETKSGGNGRSCDVSYGIGIWRSHP
jgi:hypothetical protein